MSDRFDPPAPGGAQPLPPDGPLPWENAPDAAPDPDTPRERHDAFTDARKCAFLNALMKTGCILDACRATGIAARTVYRHQESDPRFAENCRTAQAMSATPLELTAWKRAVEGVDREFACGGQVHTRRIYSDSLLRLLLQGSNPKKYGQRPGFTRKQLAKAERKQMRREVEAELRLSGKYSRASERELTESITRKLDVLERRDALEKLAAGWTKTPDGTWLPPGYGWIGLPEGGTGPDAGPGPRDGAPEPPGESM